MYYSVLIALLSTSVLHLSVASSPVLEPNTITIRLTGDLHAVNGNSFTANVKRPWPKDVLAADNANFVINGVGELTTPPSGSAATDKSNTVIKQVMGYKGSYVKTSATDATAVSGVCTMQLIDTSMKMNNTAEFTLSPEDVAESVRSKQPFYKASMDSNCEFRCTAVDDIM